MINNNLNTKGSNSGLTFNDYSVGSTWFFHLGGEPPYIKSILADVKKRGYKGAFREDIEKADAHANRAVKLPLLFDEYKDELKGDIASYRKYRCQLFKYRSIGGEGDIDFCTNLSCKYSHIYNQLAHLIYIDSLLNKSGSQMDIFGF